jgi:hypothetical protein
LFLSEALPKITLEISFPKSMVWLSGARAFARPIRSLLALLGTEVVPFTLFEVASGRTTEGHPILCPGRIGVRDADFEGYKRLLREHLVDRLDLKKVTTIDELNLRLIPVLRDRYGVLAGYSGHETGLPTSLAAAAMGACMVERHVTLDRALWGSDHAASMEPNGITRLVRDIRLVEQSLGDGVKRVLPREEPIIKRLRRVR